MNNISEEVTTKYILNIKKEQYLQKNNTIIVVQEIIYSNRNRRIINYKSTATITSMEGEVRQHLNYLLAFYPNMCPP